MDNVMIRNYLVSFLTTADGGETWELNLSSVGGWTAGKGWTFGDFNALQEEWLGLQRDGANVLVSLGGESFNPGSTINEETVDELGKAIAYSFLGSTIPPTGPYADWTPLLAGFNFDGIDFDLEKSAGEAASNEIWLSLVQSIKKYKPSAYITAAPQSPYLYNTNVESPFGVPFPGGVNETCGEISDPKDGEFLLSVSNIHLLDALNVQFYNQNGTSDFPTESNFNTRICQLVKLIQSGTEDPTTKIYVGVTDKDDGQNGNDGCETCNNAEDVGNAIKAALENAGGAVSSSWFGGVVGWESPNVNSFVDGILSQLDGGEAGFYGYQKGDPGWGE
ncbi:MAG: glycosyl hydrolase family 18 protein [Bacteroidota bacterium]